MGNREVVMLLITASRVHYNGRNKGFIGVDQWGVECVFGGLGEGWPEDKFDGFEAVILKDGQNIVTLTVRVLFLEGGDQAGHMAERLV